MRLKAEATLLLLYCLSLFLSGCDHQAKDAKTPPNILLIIADDLSWAHLGAYGCKNVNTPNIDRLASEGVLFSHAFVSTSSCTPSRASLLTGRNGFELEQGATLWGYLPEKFITYQDLFMASGFAVGATGKGWGPGFLMDRKTNPAGKLYNDIEYEPYKIQGENIWLSTIDYAANFEQFLKESGDRPFCFWMGTHEPHRGYAPGLAEAEGMTNTGEISVPPFLPDDPAVKKDINDYLFEVRHIDRQVGELLTVLERHHKLDNTIIVFTSDNGMPFPRSKATLYDYGTRMPLIIWWGANIDGGREVNDLISLTDLAPTFLEASGLEVPKNMSGKSLLSVLRSDRSGRADTTRDKVFTYRQRHSWCCAGGETFASRAVRTDDFLFIWNARPDIIPGDVDGSPTKTLLIENKESFPETYHLSFGRRPEFELYDVRSDPYQVKNLARSPQHAFVADSLKQLLFDYLESRKDPIMSGNEDIFRLSPYFGFLFELRMLEWKKDRDGRRLSKEEIKGLLKTAYTKHGEEDIFEEMIQSENW
jgi:uncharacterized sulfatase